MKTKQITLKEILELMESSRFFSLTSFAGKRFAVRFKRIDGKTVNTEIGTIRQAFTEFKEAISEEKK